VVVRKNAKRGTLRGEGRLHLRKGVAGLQLRSGRYGAVVLRAATTCKYAENSERKYPSGKARYCSRIGHSMSVSAAALAGHTRLSVPASLTSQPHCAATVDGNRLSRRAHLALMPWSHPRELYAGLVRAPGATRAAL
jgi:hypothetical protein